MAGRTSLQVARLSLALCGSLAVLASSRDGAAEVIRVSPGGRLRVQAALDRAGPGDTVRLARGVYHERVAFRKGGEHGRPVTLEGEPGAVLDGSEVRRFDWRPEIGIPGAWRSGGVPFQAFNVVADGRMVTCLRLDRVTRPKAKGKEWLWQNVFKDGIGRTKFSGVKGLALSFRRKGELLVKFRPDESEAGRDPRRMAISVAPREPCVRIEGADRCVVRGLTLTGAGYGVYIKRSLGSVVEMCRITATNHGVWLDQGSDRCTVRFCEITQNPLAVVRHSAEAWANWLAHKRGGFYDSFGVGIYRSLGGHQIHDNHIHDHWGGVSDMIRWKGDPGFEGPEINRGLNIHHNYIVNISDDGLEPNASEVDCRWHDNIVAWCICGFRIKGPRIGPMYAYRNIFFGNSEDFRNYGEVELLPAEVYVYHNTCTAKPAVMSNKVYGVGTPNYHYFSNLFYCVYWFGNSGKSLDPNWKGDYNVYVRREVDRRWPKTKALAERLGLDRHSLWLERNEPGFVDFGREDVRLTRTSPARGRGADLTKASELFGRALPGCEPGYFRGRSPDAGALQYGEPMPRLPRRPEEVKAPRAGFWPGPEE